MGRYDGQTVAVVGIGRSGVAASTLLVHEGARVIATDTREAAALGASVPLLVGLGVRLDLGGHDPAVLAAVDCIVVSPGVPVDAPVFDAARRAGVRIIGEVELAASFITAPIAAITGTNGKSTVTAFLGHIAAAAGWEVFTGGNLGTPLSEAVLRGRPWDAVVAEVSSFQLETIDTFRPAVALLLNLRPDHLDRYRGFDDYARAKARIFMNQRAGDFAVVNADDPEALAQARGIAARTFGFSSTQVLDAGASVRREADGAYRIDWRRDGRCETHHLDNPRIPGDHNAENAAAALAAARLLGVPARDVCGALNTFNGLEHRIEFVAERRGVAWYNDSKATNVDSVTVSLESFARPVIWIAGGRHKGAPYTPLRDLVKAHVKAALLIGESAPLIAADLAGAATFTTCGTLAAAVSEAARLAVLGDVVLLSPACSSYDQFTDYQERGRAFKALVAALSGGDG